MPGSVQVDISHERLIWRRDSFTIQRRAVMIDRISPEKRSWNMSRIRGSNTAPEVELRSLLHRAGCRFRLHDRKLPGKPDIVLRRYHSVIFVHGCFWHRHSGCRNATTPTTRADFWNSKFQANIERDRRTSAELAAAGWQVIIVWECELKKDPFSVLTDVLRQLKKEI